MGSPKAGITMVIGIMKIEILQKNLSFMEKLGNLLTYVLSGCDEKTASDENNHSGLGRGQLLWMIVSMMITIKIKMMLLFIATAYGINWVS